MAKGRFPCSKCDRVFVMAAHLARHVNTMHRRKGGGKAVGRSSKAKRRRGPARATAGRFSAPTSLNDGVSRVLKEMEACHGQLSFQRNVIDTQIASIESALSAMELVVPGRSSAPSRGGRGLAGPVRRGGGVRLAAGGSAGRSGSLKDRIVRVLRQKSKPMTPSDIGKAVKSSGYKTKAKDLAKAVSNTLPKLKMVKKVGRGLYSA